MIVPASGMQGSPDDTPYGPRSVCVSPTGSPPISSNREPTDPLAPFIQKVQRRAQERGRSVPPEVEGDRRFERVQMVPPGCGNEQHLSRPHDDLPGRGVREPWVPVRVGMLDVDRTEVQVQAELAARIIQEL